MKIDPLLEQMLIDRILSGEHTAYHELIRPYERQIYLAAFSVLRNEADAEDAAQEAVFKAFLSLRKFRREARFSTWLTTISINEARSRLRRNVAHPTESLDEEPANQKFSPAVLTDWREVPLVCLEQLEVRQMLQDAVADLPEIYRVTLTARDIEGLSVAETASALGITVTSAKVRLHRARMMLQKRLAPLLSASAPKPARRLRWF